MRHAPMSRSSVRFGDLVAAVYDDANLLAGDPGIAAQMAARRIGRLLGGSGKRSAPSRAHPSASWLRRLEAT